MSHAVLTGPIRGSVTLEDGTVVDVRPDVVFLDTPEQAHEVALKIGERYAVEGHPDQEYGSEFVHDVEQSKENLRTLVEKEDDNG